MRAARSAIAQLVGHASEHLAEGGELLGLQQFGLEDALRGKVAIDFHASQNASDAIEDGARGTLQNARDGLDHLQLFTDAALQVASEGAPALGKLGRLGGLHFEPRDERFEGLVPS
jgi:hypothetical protein